MQGRRDSNPQPPVLETGALPVEPLPFAPTSDPRSESGDGAPKRYQRQVGVTQRFDEQWETKRRPKVRVGSASLLMAHMVTTPAAVLLKFNALTTIHLGLRGDVIPPLTLLTFQGYLYSLVGRHLGLALTLSTARLGRYLWARRSGHIHLQLGTEA